MIPSYIMLAQGVIQATCRAVLIQQAPAFQKLQITLKSNFSYKTKNQIISRRLKGVPQLLQPTVFQRFQILPEIGTRDLRLVSYSFRSLQMSST